MRGPCQQSARGDSPRPARTAMPRRAIEINQRITRSEDAGEVCDLVETCAAEFNHVNVATAFRKLLQQRGGSDGASRGRVEPALRTLEQAAVRTIEDFQSQEYQLTSMTLMP